MNDKNDIKIESDSSSIDYKQYGVEKIKGKCNVFLAVAIVFLIMGIIILLGGIGSYSDTKDKSSLVAVIVMSVMQFLIATGLLIQMMSYKRHLKNDEEMIKIGKDLYEKDQEAEMKKNEKEVFELKSNTPDFETTKVLISPYDFKTTIWLSSNGKLVQFKLPFSAPNTQIIMKKTKVLRISNIIDINLYDEKGEIRYSQGHAIGGMGVLVAGMAGGVNASETIHKYDVVIKFDDIDQPIVRIS